MAEGQYSPGCKVEAAHRPTTPLLTAESFIPTHPVYHAPERGL
jgi:hypothetical protein